MFSTAEAELVARDPALPGLAVLLDGSQLASWLGEAGVQGVLDRRYLRYKPGVSCVLGATLTGPDGAVALVVTAYSAATRSKLDKSAERAPEGSLLARDDQRLLLATTAAADRDLPAVRLLAQDRGRRRLLRDLLPGIGGLHGLQLTTLSHKPQRRWVGKATPRHASPLVLRAYRTEDVGPAVAAVQALAELGPRTPRVLGVDERRAVAVVEWLPGRPLDQVLTAGPADAGLTAAGAALAELHAQPGAALRRQLPEQEAAAVRAAAEALGQLLPDCADAARALAEQVARRLPEDTAEPTAIHGDFSLDQVIALDEGGVALVDLDNAARGSAAADLACAAAALVTEDVLPGGAGAPSPSWAALLAGYEQHAPLPSPEVLRVRTAGLLLRRAVDPFRLCTPGWPELSAALVGHGQAVLAADR